MRKLVWLLLSLALPVRAQLDPGLATGTLAVLDFENKLPDDDKKSVDGRYFADVVRSAALRALPSLHVVTRENLLVLLESSGKRIEECEGECEVDTGRRIGADLVISGDLLKIGTNYKLNLRLHETRRGQLLAGTQASGKSVDELDANAMMSVNALLAQGGIERAPAAALPPALPPQPFRMTTGRKVAIGITGAGLLAGGGSLYFALRGKALNNDVISGNAATGAALAQDALDAKATNAPAIGLLAGAGVAIAVGVILFALGGNP